MSDSTEQHIEQLYKGYTYSSEQFDKAILFVSSGILGISITFIEKIVLLSSSQHNWLLLLSWLLEATTIALFTINHYVSVQSFNKAIKNAYNETGIESKSIKYLNLASIITLILGLILLIIFIFINIKK
ncbi:MAG: hypothetical protein ACK50L_02480 [Bacteroidota bacterium]|jgi:hypothetical protein